VSYLKLLLESPRAPTVVDAARDRLSREHQARVLLDQIRTRLPPAGAPDHA
jgi:hypothetical protein